MWVKYGVSFVIPKSCLYTTFVTVQLYTIMPKFYLFLNVTVTIWCHYNTVNCLQNIHNRHPIACLWGRDMGCLCECKHGLMFFLDQCSDGWNIVFYCTALQQLSTVFAMTTLYEWLNVRLWYCHHLFTGDTIVLHWPFIYMLSNCLMWTPNPEPVWLCLKDTNLLSQFFQVRTARWTR